MRKTPDGLENHRELYGLQGLAGGFFCRSSSAVLRSMEGVVQQLCMPKICVCRRTDRHAHIDSLVRKT